MKFEPGGLAEGPKLLPIVGDRFALESFTSIVTHHIILLRSMVDHELCVTDKVVTCKFKTELKLSYDHSDIAITGHK